MPLTLHCEPCSYLRFRFLKALRDGGLKFFPNYFSATHEKKFLSFCLLLSDKRQKLLTHYFLSRSNFLIISQARRPHHLRKFSMPEKSCAPGEFPFFAEQAALRGELTDFCTGRIGGVRLLRAFGAQNRAKEDFRTINSMLNDKIKNKLYCFKKYPK